MFLTFKVSDANRKKMENKTSIDNESDLYENNRNTTTNTTTTATTANQANQQINAKKKTSRQNSPNSGLNKQTLSSKVKDSNIESSSLFRICLEFIKIKKYIYKFNF